MLLRKNDIFSFLCFFKKQEFEIKILERLKFWIEKLQRVRFWIGKITTRQILK